MSTPLRSLFLASFGLLLAACSTTPPPQLTQPGCVGGVAPPPAGMRAAQNAELLAKAVGVPGKGGLCEGAVYQQDGATAGAIVYRVWDSAKPGSRLGRWWSFHKPQGTVAQYQAANAICPAWSQLNSVVRCQLKAGAQVAVGPGQSADCAPDPALPPSPVNQVYVPNSSPDAILVENCEDEGAFPAAL
ncbi:hypothetical protein DK842_07835 [Chromobacterium phragmitis]|uniref:Uncharacterized protein n=1 Tax=Chromobacterium phragmitis TaxID=2202141 RepID=A0A344UIV0_9NEIS|nr:hypothetical protein [Chromobacterium phragmitis]AXE29805.1 hypothetical protein DK842_07835 [Chromobacterium phragmitis]AXE35198.1 hypothetical protein DK843_13400 [Chromobacterium phragmitis]